jgi:uridine kinase
MSKMLYNMEKFPQPKTLKMAEGVSFIKKLILDLLEREYRVFVGVGGGSCAGKSMFCKLLTDSIGFGKVLGMDSYYLGIDKIKDFNFDRPDSLDLKLLEKHLKMLRHGETIQKPVYDFTIHKRVGYETFEPDRLIIVEGLFALYPPIRKQMDVLVFLDASKETRLKRRIERDVRERGRTVESVLKQFNETVEPMHKLYVEPTKRGAITIENEDNFEQMKTN